MRYQDIRLSKHFTFLDFMQGRDNYTNGLPKPAATFITAEHIQLGRELCENLLEPLIAHFGPCSIAAGCCPEADMSKGHCANSPHAWTRALGAAADVAWHDWVNAGNAPIAMMNEMRGATFERIITYAGSEFVCMAYREGVNRAALYENIRDPRAEKPPFKSYSSKASERSRWPDEFPNRADWRREEGEPIFHSRRSLRAQHIRVSRYFTLLDFCRSERGIAEGVNWVPPVTWEPGILWARRMGEVLDQVTHRVGRLSVTTGVLPKNLMSHQAGPPLHHWSHDAAGQCVRFLAPQGTNPDDVVAALTHPAVAQVRYREHASLAHEFGVIVQPFEVAHLWSSARPPVRERRRLAA